MPMVDDPGTVGATVLAVLYDGPYHRTRLGKPLTEFAQGCFPSAGSNGRLEVVLALHRRERNEFGRSMIRPRDMLSSDSVERRERGGPSRRSAS